MQLSLTLVVVSLASSASAHMSIWTPSMYGVGRIPGNNFNYTAGDPVTPLGPNLPTRASWWFRGPAFTALAPPAGAVTALPAGGSVTFEVACSVAFTSFGSQTTLPGSYLDACPNNAGAYHADPNTLVVNPSYVGGCALAIADVDSISKVTVDNLAIFSVQSACVQSKMTSFQIPARMPPCTGKKCICAWLWTAETGAPNTQFTGFDCSVTGSPADATPIAPPTDPTYCAANNGSCTTTKGSKRPIFAYNSPVNVDASLGGVDRPGYHPTWSFNNGAQNDIFQPAGYKAPVASASPAAASPAAASSKSATSTSTSAAAKSTTSTKAASTSTKATTSSTTSKAATASAPKSSTSTTAASASSPRSIVNLPAPVIPAIPVNVPKLPRHARQFITERDGDIIPGRVNVQ